MGDVNFDKMLEEFDKAAAGVMKSEPKQMKSNKPSRKLKYFFWLIFGFFSVFFAEVISGSDMLPFFNLWGIIAVIPLYTLHSLVLFYIIFKFGKPNINTIFLAGTIFGMYEAYITKVLWNPVWIKPWDPPPFKLGGVPVLEFLMLVFWWHAFFAFIIPLTLSEGLLTNSREIYNLQPLKVRKIFDTKRKSYFILIIFAVWCGGFQSGNSPNPAYSIISGLLNALFLGIMILIWRKKTNGKEFSIHDYVPNKNEFYVLFSLLLALYLITGIFMRTEAYPSIWGHVSIWIIYAVLFTLFYFNLKKSRHEEPDDSIEPQMNFSWRLYLVLALIFITSSAFMKILQPISAFFMVFGLFLGIGMGIVLFILSMIKAFKRGSPKKLGLGNS